MFFICYVLKKDCRVDFIMCLYYGPVLLFGSLTIELLLVVLAQKSKARAFHREEV